MYIKKTLKTDRKTKKTYAAFHLVESVRTERGPRQRTLLYMGSEINLPEEQYKLLAQCIEEMLQGEKVLFPYPEQIAKLARIYASQVIRHLSEPNASPEPPKEEQQQEFVNIDLQTIEQTEPRTVGAESLMMQMAHQLKLPEQLEGLGLSKTDVAIAIGTIIARAIHPSSERETYRWLCNSSGLGELLDFDFVKHSLNKFYQVSDKLLTHKNTLETSLETIEQQFHGYKSTIAPGRSH